MNCLNEAIGLALPGNGTIVATHVGRTQLFRDAARQIVENAYKYYRDGDECHDIGYCNGWFHQYGSPLARHRAGS